MEKKDEYGEGGDMKLDGLMNLVDNKYNNLKLKDKCNTPSAEEKNILTLEVKIQLFENKRKKDQRGAKET